MCPLKQTITVLLHHLQNYLFLYLRQQNYIEVHRNYGHTEHKQNSIWPLLIQFLTKKGNSVISSTFFSYLSSLNILIYQQNKKKEGTRNKWDLYLINSIYFKYVNNCPLHHYHHKQQQRNYVIIV